MKKRIVLVASIILASLSLPTFVLALPSPSEGEDQQFAGPVTAPVDPNYSSQQAATNHMMHGMSSTGMDGMTSTSTAASDAASAAALDPAVYGQWSKKAYPTLARSVHVTLLHNGKVLLIQGSGNIASDNNALKAYVWTPTTGEMKSVPPPYDMFCAGHVALSNGDILVMGGTTLYASQNSGKWSGSGKSYKFSVATETWVALPPMRDGRWYPTAIMKGDGKVDVYGGFTAFGANNILPERYDPVANTWTTLPQRTMPLYAGLVLMANGKYYYTGAKNGAEGVGIGIFGESGAKQAVNGVTSPSQRRSSTALLVGDANVQLSWLAGGGFPAIGSTIFTDLKPANPVAVPGPNLPVAKAYISAVNLPNLQTFETGGGTALNTPVFEASSLNPVSRTITPMAPPTVGRTYHSSAILLPDGTVATLGGDPSGAAFEMSIEIYKPPYMFKGTRPTISSGASELTYGTPYNYGATAAAGSTLTSAVLARPMSTTHSTDANQRTIKLTSTVTATGMRIIVPTNRNIAPPGWYMLFINDSVGRPSVARWVHIQ